MIPCRIGCGEVRPRANTSKRMLTTRRSATAAPCTASFRRKGLRCSSLRMRFGLKKRKTCCFGPQSLSSRWLRLRGFGMRRVLRGRFGSGEKWRPVNFASPRENAKPHIKDRSITQRWPGALSTAQVLLRAKQFHIRDRCCRDRHSDGIQAGNPRARCSG